MKDRRRRIAEERISILLSLAKERALDGDIEHASRYSFLARKIGMRYNVRMPRGFKLAYCRRCGTYLLPSATARFRLTGGKLTRQCIKCGSYYRMPIGDKGKGVGD